MFHRFLPCTQDLRRRGKRLHATKAQRLTPTYAEATTLTIIAGPPRPQLTVEAVDLRPMVYAGEEVSGALRITNIGKVAVEDVQVLTSEAGAIRLNHSIGMLFLLP